MRMRRGFRLTALGGLLAAALLAVAPAAYAAPPAGLDPIVLPQGTARVWIELEQSGLSAAAVVVRTENGGSAAELAMAPTTTGLHGELVAAPGPLQLVITPTTGAPAASPDLAVTALDAQNRVLLGSDVRLSIPAGPKRDGETPKPAEPKPEEPAAAGGTKPRGGLDRTGGDGPGWLVLAGAVLVLAGGSAWGLRRLRASREEAAR